jgi:hypothetical protein
VEFSDLLKLGFWILVIGASVLGPMVENWRRKKEQEAARRRAAERGEAPPPPEPEAPSPAPQEPTLPYEDVLQEVFGPYIERRKKAYEEAKRRAMDAAPAEEEVEEADEEEELDREVRTIREAKATEEVFRQPLPDEAVSPAAAPQDPSSVPVVTSSARRIRTLDERLFSNPRFTAGAKLVLASEILGRPKSRRR